MIELYDDPAQMGPLVIDSSRSVYNSLIGFAHELSEASAGLDAALVPATERSLSELVSGMNCYYSNLIEGYHTLPIDIEKALLEIKDQMEQKDLQSLAFAHIEADRWAKLQQIDKASLLPFILEVHRRFYEHLPQEMLKLKDGSYMEPGKFRERDVHVGIHVAPRADKLTPFLERFTKVYGPRLECATKDGISKLDGILAAFAAHHRLVWIHPFLDGNGRVARITVDAMLRACGVNGASLRSMSRGFAKSAEKYKSKLAAADLPRMGDLDGRGNLSEKRLAEFCEYAMQTAIDQAKFMAQMFALDNFKFRAEHFSGKCGLISSLSRHTFLFMPSVLERSSAWRPAVLPVSLSGRRETCLTISSVKDSLSQIPREARFESVFPCMLWGLSCLTFIRQVTWIWTHRRSESLSKPIRQPEMRICKRNKNRREMKGFHSFLATTSRTRFVQPVLRLD